MAGGDRAPLPFAAVRDVGRYLLEEFAGVRVPDIPRPPDEPPKLDLGRYAGQYRRLGVDIELAAEEGSLAATVRPTGALAEFGPPQQARFARSTLRCSMRRPATWRGSPISWTSTAANAPRYLHIGGRVSRRVEGTGAEKKAVAPATHKREPTPRKRSANAKGTRPVRSGARKPAVRTRRRRASS